MLTFAVVVSRSGGPVPRRVLDVLHDRVGADVPFEPAHHLVWSSENGNVWFAGWQDASEPDAPAHHWHVDSDGLTAFAGHLWPRREGWPGSGPWAEQLARHLRGTSMPEGTADLAGIYLAVSLPGRGVGSVGSDPLGFGLVHWGEGHDIVVFSSRAAVAARLLAAEQGGEPKRDAFGAGWMIYSMRAMGLQTAFEQVQVLPQGAVATIEPAGGVRLAYPSPPPWRRPFGDSFSPEDALAETLAEMRAFTRAALARPGQAGRAGLTGGKDSRLILAVLMADGSAGDVEFETLGKDDLPDVVVARHVAAALGLRHAVNPHRAHLWEWRKQLDAALGDAGHGDLSAREAAFRLTAWACAGSRSVFAPHLGKRPIGNAILFNGMFGETFRTHFGESTRFASLQRVASFPIDLKFGTAGILRPDALAQYRDEMHSYLFEDARESDSAQDVMDSFGMRHWLRRWFGSTQEIDAEGRMFPLYSIAAIRLAFTVGAENRHSEWIHYHLMRAACEQLVEIPFADGGWNAGADGPLQPVARHHEQVPKSPPRLAGAGPVKPSKKPWKRTVVRDRRAELEATDLDIMRRYLRADSANPVFEIIDPVATNRLLDGFETLPERQKLQLYGALTAAIWLGGHEIELPRTVHST